MFGLVKSKQKTTIKNLVNATEEALNNLYGSMEGDDTLLERLGVDRQYAFDAIMADDEVAACLEDLRAAMLSKPFRIYGENLDEETADRLWKTLRRQLPNLVEIVLSARLGGYGVARYVYAPEPDGFIGIRQVSNKAGELYRFRPWRDGSLVYRGAAGDEPCDINIQYLFLAHRPTSTNPAGEMAAARLYAPVALRKKGFVYAAQFITRYAQPYLVAQIQANDEAEHNGFLGRLYQMINGGAMTIDREDTIQMLQNSADGQAFKRLENLANARIQKTLLGKVKTSDLETSSRAAQETEEAARVERIGAYMMMLSQACQHFIDALVMVNNVWGLAVHAPKGVWFEFEEEVKVDVQRAERDKKYLESGSLRLTRDYYRDVLGFDEAHFEIVEPAMPSETQTAKLSLKLSDGLNPAKQPLTVEQTVMQPKIQAVLSALEECNDYAEFETRLSQLDLSATDNILIQRLVSDGLKAWSEGATDE